MSIFYVFSLLGVFLFGGKIYNGNPDISKDVSIPASYIFNNFNDFPSGFMTLFELTVVNNWRVIVQMMTNVTSTYYRWYFILFYIFAVTMSLNLIVSFIIDMFYSQWELAKEKKRKSAKFLEERKENNDMADPLINPVVNMRSSLTAIEVVQRWVDHSH